MNIDFTARSAGPVLILFTKNGVISASTTKSVIADQLPLLQDSTLPKITAHGERVTVVAGHRI
jgi:hypothetical protein